MVVGSPRLLMKKGVGSGPGASFFPDVDRDARAPLRRLAVASQRDVADQVNELPAAASSQSAPLLRTVLKHYWWLSAMSAEKSALSRMLSSCQ